MSLLSPSEFLELNGFKNPDSNLPVFKYTAVEAFRKIIGNLTLQFSTPDTFKDTQELLFDRLDPTLSDEDYRRIFKTYVEPITQPGSPVKTFEEAIEALPIEKFQEAHKYLYDTVRKTALIFCSTTDFKSERMWKEYAEDETGICFSFRLMEDFHIPHVVCVSKHVKYTDDVVPRRQFPQTMQDLMLALYNWIFIKTNSFSFEDEIRTYIYRDINKISRIEERYYYPFKPQVILEVYFGVNCSSTSISEISELLLEQKCLPKKYKMIKVGNTYTTLQLP